MMRIKEAIQRRRLIQQLNDEYLATQIDPEPHPSYGHKRFSSAKLSCTTSYGGWGSSPPTEVGGGDDARKSGTEFVGGLAENNEAYISLAQFVGEFNGRLTDGHRRALRVTWNRLSEPPKTSGRGILKVMERIFDDLMGKNPEMLHCFYRSAFIKCMEDRKRRIRGTGTIVTIRDHAHLLIELIDGIMCTLFDVPHVKPIWDPVAIGKVHARLIPFGFDKEIWHTLGAVLAEVMFCQECVRAYPLAASAWSMLSVALTDRMFRHTKLPVPMGSISKNSGDWSQQTSMNIESTLLNLSADLQRKAMISLRGSGHCPSSTASSFRRASECVKLKRIEMQKQNQEKRMSVGWRQRAFSKEGRSASLAGAAPQSKAPSEARRDSSIATAVKRRERPKLEKAPSFFSRTIASLTGPMPSSSSSFDSHQHRKGSGHRSRSRSRRLSPSSSRAEKGPSPLAMPQNYWKLPQKEQSSNARPKLQKKSPNVRRLLSEEYSFDYGK